MNTINISSKDKFLLALQHFLAMFSATILVPILVGLNIPTALLTAGLGSFVFSLLTKKKIPAMLSSSFAYIGGLQIILKNEGIGAVKCGIFAVVCVYVLFYFLVKMVGIDKLKKVLPSIIIGPIIMLIGFRLLPAATGMIGFQNNSISLNNFIIASVVVLTIIIFNNVKNGFLKVIPILIGILVGYFVSICFGVVNFSIIKEATWFSFSGNVLKDLFALPTFSLNAIMIMAPLAVVTLIENIGDIETISKITKKDLMKDPGFDKSLLGFAGSNFIASLFGSPATTTYGENIGVMEVSKNSDTSIFRLTSFVLIFLSFFGKITALFRTIPDPVLGAVSLVLFGSISSVGIRTLIDNKINLSKSKNLLVVSLILGIGLGVNSISITQNLSISGLILAGIVGIILNLSIKD